MQIYTLQVIKKLLLCAMLSAFLSYLLQHSEGSCFAQAIRFMSGFLPIPEVTARMITGHFSSSEFNFIAEMEKDVDWCCTGVSPLPSTFFFYVLLTQARRTIAGLLPSAQIKASHARCGEHPQNRQWAESGWRSGPFKPPSRSRGELRGDCF